MRDGVKEEMQTATLTAQSSSALDIRMLPYTGDWTEAVAEFNHRVGPGNPPFRVPETPSPLWLPRVGDAKIYQEIFLAVDGGYVRGAYTFKHQEFSVNGRIQEVGMCRMPISEGLVNRRYSVVGMKLLNDALRRQPLLYGLGLGGLDSVIARMVQAMGWRPQKVVPFYFKVQNGFHFLRNIQHLRTTRLRRWLLDAAAYSGLGWSCAQVAASLCTKNSRHQVFVEQAGEFSDWADNLWDACRSRYSFIAVRDASVLNILYPRDNPRFIKLKVHVGNRVAGWAVLLDTLMSHDKYFGNMRVGSIVDCLAQPEDADRVIAAAAGVLENRGVHLMLSNQRHPAWCAGLSKAGFMEGPSNFFFITSKQLTPLLHEADPAGTGIHLNRGDGDGPIHL